MTSRELGTFEGERQFSFPTEDPLLPVVRDRLTASPSLLEQTQRLFSRGIVQARDEIIGVRCEDVVTLLDHITRGRIPVGLPDWASEPLIWKSEGDYYLSPIPDNPFYNSPETERLVWGREDSSQSAFYDRTSRVIRAYADRAVLATALTRTLSPIFRPDWRERAIVLAIHSDTTNRGFDVVEDADFLFELFTRSLDIDLHHAAKIGLNSEQILSVIGRKKAPAAYMSSHSLPQRGINKEEVASFLLGVARERGSVIAGFNKRVVQGELFEEALFDEIYIRPEKGFIDLSQDPISAIEPLGTYEDRVLQELGVIK